MTIEQFLKSFKQADKGVASDDAIQRGYRQECPKYPFHVATLPPHGTTRKFLPIKSVSLEQLDGGQALVLKVDDALLLKVNPSQKLDGVDCPSADQIAATVRNISEVTDSDPVLISIGNHITSVSEVTRKMVNTRNARICLS